MKTTRLLKWIGFYIFLVWWVVTGSQQVDFYTYLMQMLIGVVAFYYFVFEVYILGVGRQSFGPYPLGRVAKEKLIKNLADQETKMQNKMEILQTLFFPLSILALGVIVFLITQPLEDPRLVMEHSAKIVTGVLFTLTTYTGVLIIGYLTWRLRSKILSDLSEDKKGCIFAMNFDK